MISLPKKMLSIISASNRPHNMHGFLENLLETVDNPNCIELLVKIDEGDDAMQSLMEEAVKKYPFEIRYIQTPRLNGYYTLHFGYQQLWEISNPETYFIFPVNEEVRFTTKGWDSVLANYIKLYDDDLFRLKISRLKYRNYYSIYECGPTPENYPFFTRKWMELADGIGDCWGPDGWHQYIDYHLGLTEGVNEIPGIFRSIPIQDILISGEEAGKELTPQQIKIRSHRIFQEWWRMYRLDAQYEFRRIAVKMFAYIWAKNQGLNDFHIINNSQVKKFQIRDKSGYIINKDFYYHISPLNVYFENFRFLIKMARRNSIGFLTAFIYPSYGSTTGIKSYITFFARYFLVVSAVILSFFTFGSESIPKRFPHRIRLRLRAILSFIINKISEFISNEEINNKKTDKRTNLAKKKSLFSKIIKLLKIITLLTFKLIRLSYRPLKNILTKIIYNPIVASISFIKNQFSKKIKKLKQYLNRLYAKFYFPNPLK